MSDEKDKDLEKGVSTEKTETTLSISDELKKRVDELESANNELKASNADLKDKYENLSDKLEETKKDFSDGEEDNSDDDSFSNKDNENSKLLEFILSDTRENQIKELYKQSVRDGIVKESPENQKKITDIYVNKIGVKYPNKKDLNDVYTYIKGVFYKKETQDDPRKTGTEQGKIFSDEKENIESLSAEERYKLFKKYSEE